MKIRNILFLLPVFGIMAFQGCKSQYEMLLASNDVEMKYQAAWTLYQAGKYKKSAAMFESLTMLTAGTERDDTVRFYWAMSNYKYEDYVTADANFTSFIEFYPRSPFTPEARFLKLDCMYRSTYRYELDQTPSNLAIVAISEYIIEYPQSDRLDICRKMLDDLNERIDTKAYQSAYLYYKMEDYKAAKVALKNVLKDNADNLHREEILYYITRSSYKYASLSVPQKQKERYMEFVDDYYNYIGEYPDSDKRKALDQLYARAQKAMKGTLTKEDIKAEKAIK